ncbi:hypothetical protein FWH13_04080 [Candidatus Saccharibacteria bacterium]|nr:hypothetical protein [Candidatus Saccharibacteria bacterium]
MLQVFYNSTLLELPVWSLQTAEPVAELLAPIIDPDKMRIEAFYVRDVDRREKILTRGVIREVGVKGIVINTEDDLSDLVDLPKLLPLAEADWSPIGRKVLTKKQELLGEVVDYTVAGDDLFVYQLDVEAPRKLLKRPKHPTFLINRSQIIEYDNERFIVRGSEELAIEERIDFSEFYNPFRSSLLDSTSPFNALRCRPLRCSFMVCQIPFTPLLRDLLALHPNRKVEGGF